MADEILTIALDGEITLADLAEAMQRFQALVDALAEEVAGDARIEWRLEDVQIGSALATLRAASPDPEASESVVRAFAAVGAALQRQDPIPYSADVQRRTTALTQAIKGSVSAIRFETPFSDALIPNRREARPAGKITYSFGEIKGTVETLSRRHGLRFMLYDPTFNRAISCYLDEGQEELVRDVWGRSVIVSGQIGREPIQQRPVVIRHIREVRVLDETPGGDYRRARGVLQAEQDGDRPEARIRSMRDAW